MHRSRNILRRTALSAAAALVLGGLASMSIDAATPVASMAATATHATQFGSGDMLNGMVPFTKSIHIEVALKLRNTDALNAILRVQSPRDLLRVEGDLLKDNLQDLLSISARISELSAEFANQAVEKLDVRTQEAAHSRRRA